MNRDDIKTDINGNIYTNTTKRIKGNTVRDRLLKIADWFLNWESDVTTTIGGTPSDTVLPTEKAVADYVAANGGSVTTLEQANDAGTGYAANTSRWGDAGDSTEVSNSSGVVKQMSGKTTSIVFETPSGNGVVKVPDVGNDIRTLATTDQIPAYNDRFKGKYTSSSALTTAHPTASDGDYAIVDSGSGSSALEYIWDAEDGWVASASSGASSTDALPEGSSNLYFTNSRALAAAPAETVSSIGTLINGASAATPADADKFGFVVSSVLKAITWLNLKAAMLADAVVGSAIAGYTGKTTPVDADVFVGSDSADTNKAKKFTWANIKTAMFGESVVGSAINGYTGKTTPVGGDSVLITDSADTNKAKKVSFTDLLAYFGLTFVNASRSAVIAQTAVDGANAVGTAQTYSTGVAIDTAKLQVGDVLSVNVAMRRNSGNNSTITVWLYANTTNDFAGSPILLATSTTMAATSYRQVMHRFFAVKAKASSGNTIEGFPAATAALAEVGATVTANVSNHAINTLTGTFYIVAIIKTFASGDSGCVSFLSVTRG